MKFVTGWIKEFICKNDPTHIGAFLADVFELAALAVMLGMVVRLYIKIRTLHKKMKEYHPDA
jgi:hypothetical protein